MRGGPISLFSWMFLFISPHAPPLGQGKIRYCNWLRRRKSHFAQFSDHGNSQRACMMHMMLPSSRHDAASKPGHGDGCCKDASAPRGFFRALSYKTRIAGHRTPYQRSNHSLCTARLEHPECVARFSRGLRSNGCQAASAQRWARQRNPRRS